MNNRAITAISAISAPLVRLIACLMAVIALALPASAAAQDPVSSNLEAYIVKTDKDGREQFKKADRVTPGELIEYRITYKNNTADPLGEFTVKGDVPAKTAYVAGSQKSNVASAFQAEIADLGWVDIPAFREIQNPDGTVERVQVSPDEYDNLRWRLSENLAPDKEVNVIYRIKVDK